MITGTLKAGVDRAAYDEACELIERGVGYPDPIEIAGHKIEVVPIAATKSRLINVPVGAYTRVRYEVEMMTRAVVRDTK